MRKRRELCIVPVTTISQMLPPVGLLLGIFYGAMLGSKFAPGIGIIGAIVGGALGYNAGRIASTLVLNSIPRDFGKRTVTDMRPSLTVRLWMDMYKKLRTVSSWGCIV